MSWDEPYRNEWREAARRQFIRELTLAVMLGLGLAFLVICS